MENAVQWKNFAKGFVKSRKEGNVGEYLDKHLVPGHLYVIEHIPDFVTSCLYHTSKPMLVFSSKVCGGQLLMEAAEIELSAHSSKLEDNDPYSPSREMVLCEKLGELEKKPIWIDESEKLMAMNLHALCQKLRLEQGIQIVLMDDYQFLVDDFFQEITDELKLTMLQSLSEKLGIAVVAQKYPLKKRKHDRKKTLEPVFLEKWWEDSPTPEQNTGSILDYWES